MSAGGLAGLWFLPGGDFTRALIAHAASQGFLLSCAERREQESDEERHHADDDEELDQSEGAANRELEDAWAADSVFG